MKDIELNIQDIKDLMAGMSRNRISSLKLTQGSFCLELEGQLAVSSRTALPEPRDPIPVSAAEEDEPISSGLVVKSPIVGTYYAAPAPGKPPFVVPGSQVKKGDVLFIIESMKLMNEVLCEKDGTVAQVLVEDAQAVEFGQPILCME